MERYRFSPQEQALLEGLKQPFAVFQYIDKRVVPVLLSEGFCELFGYTEKAQAYRDIENNLFTYIHPDDADRVVDATARFITEGGAFEAIYRGTKLGSSDYTMIHACGRHVYTESGTRLGQIWYMDEGTYSESGQPEGRELNKALSGALHEESILKSNRYDYLTGLPSLAYFFELAENGKNRISGEGGNAVLLYLDLYGMKYFNHKYGFREGDKLLLGFSRLLANMFGEENCCHIGADRFTAFSREDGLEDAMNRLFLEAEKINGGNSLPVKIGVYSTSLADVPVSEAYDRAKIACDALRNVYGSGYYFYSQALQDEADRRQYILSNLDRALREKWVKVYYQPIVRSITGRVCDEEALARWIDPVRGFMSPADFIPALENAGLIYKLDLYVLEQVLEKIQWQRASGLHVVPQSINLSRADFEVCDIVEEIRKRVDAANISRSLITIEITESIIGSDFEFMRKQVFRFQALGFPVWMDDFGSGYSSLNTLKDYKFDELKIDMAFLSNFNDVSRIIISSTVRMAKKLGLKTLAEGVETREQMEFLKSIGCEKVQGYFYGKPQPLKDTLKHMESTGIIAEDSEMRSVYSKIGSIDYLVDSPKAILSYENGWFRFLFVNKQFEEQVLGVGFNDVSEVEKSINNPENPVYYTLHEAEKAAYKAPSELTYATHGKYVFIGGSLIADINGCHIYDLTLRNTHVTAYDSSSSNKNVALPTDAKTILLADVNPQNRAFLESFLKSDYNLLLAEDGEQALSLLLEHGNRISLALIDADLPKLDGFKIIQKFQSDKRDLQIPFIIMTDNMELAKESIRLGAYQFIHTPINDKGMIKAKIDGAIKNSEFLHQVALNYMEFVPGGVILFSARNGEILYVNARVLDIFECDNVEQFREFAGVHFKNVILPEDFDEVNEALRDQILSRSDTTKQMSYRARTYKGKVKRIYHVGKVFMNTPYGSIFSAFLSEDDMAMKSYFTRKDTFAKFMASGEATHTKSYDPGYKGFLFWNLTKNSPVIRMDGISYIPEEMAGRYTYEVHYKYLSSLMLKDEDNLLKVLNYTREKLILDFMNKCMVPSLDVSYDIENYSFTIRSNFNMMMDPDSGDIILKLQNESIKTNKEV